MNLLKNPPHNAERFPFRRISTTSFIIGTLSLLLGAILLLSVKPQIAARHHIKTGTMLVGGLGMIALGIRYLKRGYIYEYKFDMADTYNPSQQHNINHLMGQREAQGKRLAYIYASMLQSKSYALADIEKRPISHWQRICYELLSKGKLTRVIDVLPYPITSFIVSQSNPLAILGYFLLSLCILFFLSWLELFSLNMTLINLFLFTGLLSLWKPARIDNVIKAERKKDLLGKLIVFIFAFLGTLSLYSAYKGQINSGVLISMLFLAAVMVISAVLAFRIINTVYSLREKVQVTAAELPVHTYRANTQPINILNQFDNMVRVKTGWSFKQATRDSQGMLAGSQHNKGDFEFEYVYETFPVLLSTTHDTRSQALLKYVWRLGTALLCLGLASFFIGILTMPSVDMTLLKEHPELALSDNATAIFLSLFFTLFGLAIYFFGGKLVYEIYLFFHTELFFESNLIVFKASGNYDEFEQISGSIKRKDTSTDYIPNIKVCKVISSVFMHPYMNDREIPEQPRFLVKTEKNDTLLNEIWQGFQETMQQYSVAYLP